MASPIARKARSPSELCKTSRFDDQILAQIEAIMHFEHIELRGINNCALKRFRRSPGDYIEPRAIRYLQPSRYSGFVRKCGFRSDALDAFSRLTCTIFMRAFGFSAAFAYASTVTCVMSSSLVPVASRSFTLARSEAHNDTPRNSGA